MPSSLKRLQQEIRGQLKTYSTPEKIASTQRYFPAGIKCLGVKAQEIDALAKHFIEESHLDADQRLALCEHLLASTDLHEEKLFAYRLIQGLCKKHYEDSLLDRFRFWLEHYADNWALVDDLCMKAIYQFFLSRTHLISHTNNWADSASPWCRRASNVAWVKLVYRKIGRTEYWLDTELAFIHLDKLKEDDHEFVQKSNGWLLKVLYSYHPELTGTYLRKNKHTLPKATLRYALEKASKQEKDSLLKG